MSAIQELRETVARLRAPGGCPWDRAQTHQSLSEYLIEEAHELLDALDNLDYEHMREELGDVLLQILLHAQIAEENGKFDFEDVARILNEKLIRRHPHVFGDVEARDAGEVVANWEKIKAGEKKEREPQSGILNHIPKRLPALLYARDAFKLLKKRDLLETTGKDLDTIGQLADELDEEQLGTKLFQLAAASRLAGIDPESALRRYAKNLVKTLESQPE